MDTYVAIKPVRFDRNYSVGETIPGIVIDPKTVKRLIDLGKIHKATAPVPADPEPDTEISSHLDPAQFDEDGWTDDQLRALAADLGIELEDGAERSAIIALIAAVEIDPEDTLEIDPANYTGEDEPKDPAEGQETPVDEQDGAEGTTTPPEAETPVEGQETPQEATAEAKPEFVCDVCGKVCGTKTALTAHKKTHTQ